MLSPPKGTESIFNSGMNSQTQALVFAAATEAEAVNIVGEIASQEMRRTGILASVITAQFILESGFGKSELSLNANNLFGMKATLSGNDWETYWDGISIYTKQTEEQNLDGSRITIIADFRRYACIEDSIKDHSAYLLGAKDGDHLRYAGIQGERDYRRAIELIKAGGYATDLSYVEHICSLIEQWDLTRFDI